MLMALFGEYSPAFEAETVVDFLGMPKWLIPKDFLLEHMVFEVILHEPIFVEQFYPRLLFFGGLSQ